MKYNNPRVSRSITNQDFEPWLLASLNTNSLLSQEAKFFNTSLKQITITQSSTADDVQYSHADIQM